MQEKSRPKNEYLAILQSIAEDVSVIRQTLMKPEKKQLSEEEQEAEYKRIISDVFGD